MEKNSSNIMDAIERLNFTLKKINEFDNDLNLQLSAKILDNRIITLEGYLRYLESEGIPKIRKISEVMGADNID